MTKVYILLAFIFSSFLGSGQKLYDVKLDNCLLKFVMEDEQEIIYYEENDSILIVDFLKGLDEKYVDRLKGGIMFQVMVDTISNICCVSYTNKTTVSDKRLQIPDRVKQMKGWKRVPGIRPNENICALVSLIFDKNDVYVIRTGYNRNKGKRMLSQQTFLRYEPEIAIDSLPNANEKTE